MGVSRRLGRTSTGLGERRGVCRYEATETCAWLGWWMKEQFQSTPAEVEDLSLRGCRMTVEQLPPPDLPVWFCPAATASIAGSTVPSTSSDWLEAKVIESRKRLFGPRQVRIVFRRSFPYEVFKTVVYGPERAGGLLPKLWIPESNVSDELNCDLW